MVTPPRLEYERDERPGWYVPLTGKSKLLSECSPATGGPSGDGRRLLSRPEGQNSGMAAPPPPGTIVLWSDIGCPWAHATVGRLLRVRDELGLRGEVVLDHRVFPLELINNRPTPKVVLDAEVPVAGALEPGAGWQMWQAAEWSYPVTTLLAMEAVQAAKEQSLEASEALDQGLRRAMFGQSRCISVRGVILEVAEECPVVDAAALAEALDSGVARRTVMDQAAEASTAGIQGSPHLFLPDGSDVHNPGVGLHWEGVKGRGFPVVHAFDPSVYEELLHKAATPVGA